MLVRDFFFFFLINNVGERLETLLGPFGCKMADPWFFVGVIIDDY